MQKSFLAVLMVLSLVLAGSPSAQNTAVDPLDRLRETLPADVAGRVLARITEAKAKDLPADAMVNRALKFAARGIAPADIERSVNEHAARLEHARNLLKEVRADRPSEAEVEAGAEALRVGVSASAVSALAKSAPSGRSLEVPLFVIGSLVDRGLPSDEALQRVLERLRARAGDAELEQLPAQVGSGPAGAKGGGQGQQQGKGAQNRPPGARGRPATAGGGRPASVPANPGKGQGKNPDR